MDSLLMHHKLSGLAKKYQSWELTVVNTGMSCPSNLHSLFIHFYVKKNVIFFLYFFTTHQTWKQLLLWALNLLLKRHQLQHFMTVTKKEEVMNFLPQSKRKKKILQSIVWLIFWYCTRRQDCYQSLFCQFINLVNISPTC